MIVKHLSANLLLLLIGIFLSGCMSLGFKQQDVKFFDPDLYLRATEIAPADYQKQCVESGITLRLSMPENGCLEYVEFTQMFVRIEGKQGYGTDLTRKIVQKYRRPDGPDAPRWIVSNESTLLGASKDKIVEEIEMTDRGEILRCISGEHSSKGGKIKITGWKRSPVFPVNPVNPGDRWTYTEKMNVELDSFWVSRKSDSPDSIEANSTFQGFAKLRNRLCAVIVTRAVQKKRETIGTLMKKITMDITAYVTETLYFDFRDGVIVGKKTKTEVFSISDDGNYSDMSQSQTVTILSPGK